MAYTQLTEDLIIGYIKELDSMKKIFSSFDDMDVREVGDGNLNYVYIITNKKDPDETVVLKQAVPFLRVVGESWPLDIERMNFEVAALKKEYEICQGLVPEVYHADSEMSLVIMQNLNKHQIVRDEMNRGVVFPKMPDHVSTFLARMVFFTSDWGMARKTEKWPDHDTSDKKEMVRKFINKDLCNLTENFIFSYPFYSSDTNSYPPGLSEADIKSIQEDGELKQKATLLRYKFMNNAEVLLHGDLHTGSIMANEKETYVIDPEFAFYGPAGFDTGLLLGNLLLAYIGQIYWQKRLGNNPSGYRSWILDVVRGIWNGFAEKYDTLWRDHQKNSPDPLWDFPGGDAAFAELRRKEVERIFHDAAGFAGTVMIRRTLGLAKVSDITSIEEPASRTEADKKVLEIGKKLILQAEVMKSVDEMITIAQEVSPL